MILGAFAHQLSRSGVFRKRDLGELAVKFSLAIVGGGTQAGQVALEGRPRSLGLFSLFLCCVPVHSSRQKRYLFLFVDQIPKIATEATKIGNCVVEIRPMKLQHGSLHYRDPNLSCQSQKLQYLSSEYSFFSSCIRATRLVLLWVVSGIRLCRLSCQRFIA